MIRVYTFLFLNYILNWTKHHWRLADRITFLQVILQPFDKIWSEWAVWRDKSVTRAYVSNQTISLEWYLNMLYNNGGTEIYIVSAGPGGVSLGLEALGGAEAALFVTEGLEALGGVEEAAYVVYPLEGEDVVTGGNSFAVFVPNVLISYNDLIKGVVNNYRYAGKTFIIINY